MTRHHAFDPTGALMAIKNGASRDELAVLLKQACHAVFASQNELNHQYRRVAGLYQEMTEARLGHADLDVEGPAGMCAQCDLEVVVNHGVLMHSNLQGDMRMLSRHGANGCPFPTPIPMEVPLV